MAIVKIYNSGEHQQVWFFCPGCKTQHAFTTKHPGPFKPWGWNLSVDKPTFRPSLMVDRDHPASRCHSFVTDGNIQFLDDCHHDLKGKTIPLPEIDA